MLFALNFFEGAEMQRVTDRSLTNTERAPRDGVAVQCRDVASVAGKMLIGRGYPLCARISPLDSEDNRYSSMLHARTVRRRRS